MSIVFFINNNTSALSGVSRFLLSQYRFQALKTIFQKEQKLAVNSGTFELLVPVRGSEQCFQSTTEMRCIVQKVPVVSKYTSQVHLYLSHLIHFLQQSHYIFRAGTLPA